MTAAAARLVWPDVPCQWDDIDPADDPDMFVMDATPKLSERAGDAISGVPTMAAYLPGAPSTPVSDLIFGTVAVVANPAGLAAQMGSFTIDANSAPVGNTYKVTMTFATTSGRLLNRSELLTVNSR